MAVLVAVVVAFVSVVAPVPVLVLVVADESVPEDGDVVCACTGIFPPKRSTLIATSPIARVTKGIFFIEVV